MWDGMKGGGERVRWDEGSADDEGRERVGGDEGREEVGGDEGWEREWEG